MQIVILDGYTENPGDLSWAPLEALGQIKVSPRTPEEPAEILRRIGKAEAVLTNKTPLTKEVLARCANLSYIGVLATGYNVVDIQAAAACGITVTNIPSYGTQAVAQFAIALLLELCHHIGHHSRAVHEGRWSQSEDFCFWDTPQIELAGQTLGLIGCGRIGQATGRIAAALGMRVIAYDEQPSTAGRQIARFVDLDTLYREADVISLHCPLTAQNRGMIGQESLARMKDGVLIVNNARGPLIDERALCDALNSGKVAGAALDVVSSEPLQADNPLLSAKHCVITPHIAWASRESRARLMNIAADNLKAFLDGRPQNVING